MHGRWDRRYRLVLLLLVAICLGLITLSFRAGPSGVVAATREAVLAVTTPVARAMDWVASPFVGGWRFLSGLGTLTKRNEELQREVAELSERAARAKELEVENQSLRKLAGMTPAPPGRTAVASVVGHVPGGWERGLLIDVGRSRGVRLGAPVVVAGGIVGQVVRVGSNGAEVRLITDPRGGTGALVQETRDTGVVRGSVTGDLYLRYIPRESAVKKGDTVVTSGLGQVFPKGLVIGTVLGVDDPGSGLYKDIAVLSRVEYGRLERVTVLLDYPKAIQQPRGGR